MGMTSPVDDPFQIGRQLGHSGDVLHSHNIFYVTDVNTVLFLSKTYHDKLGGFACYFNLFHFTLLLLITIRLYLKSGLLRHRPGW